MDDNLSKLLVITGPTKTGKTVLVDKIFPRDNSVWIDCGTVNDENSFWELIVEQLKEFTELEDQESESSAIENGADGGIEGSIAVVKGKSNIHTNHTSVNETVHIKRRTSSNKIVALRGLQQERIPLIVDDFHYLDKRLQKNIVRAVKSPIMHGLPVIFIAIPNRKYDTVEVEREMTGRISTISMPTWEKRELMDIATVGFEKLNIIVPDEIISGMADAAYGSPFLMQEFCNTLCKHFEILEACIPEMSIPVDFDMVNIYHNLADNSGRPMFDKLKRGPRARSDRKQRLLKTGTKTDIYGVVMESLKNIKPGVESIRYEELRNNIKNILDEAPPQKNEVTRVLDKIARISYSDSSSTPVIDWQKEDNLLTITDPFFAFYLKWANPN